MNILINCSSCKVGGGIQVSHSFMHELKNIQNNYYVVIMSSVLAKQIDTSDFDNNFLFFTYDIKANPISTIFSSNDFLDRIVNEHSIEKVFTVFGPAYWRPKVTHICGYAKPHYVYKNSPFFKLLSKKDMVVLKVKEFFHLLDFKKNSDLIVTENEDVTKKISKIIEKKIFTVTNNYNQIFDNEDLWKTKFLPSFNGQYLLTISANYPHKNLRIIPKIIEVLIRRKITRFKFVLTLKKGDLQSSEEIDRYIEYIGHVSINECPSLYSQTNYMFLPTLLECFSASYAEAMKMNKIILTSDLDFAKGICEDSAIYFNPLDAEDIVNKLIAVDNDSILQKKLIENGKNRLSAFDTATERANKYIEIIKNS